MTRWPALVAAVPAEDKVRPGWLGFLVVAGLCVVTYLLWRSMNTQLKRVDFEPGQTEAQESNGDQTAAAAEPEAESGGDDPGATDPTKPDDRSHPDGASS
jgi:hypothetical protein